MKKLLVSVLSAVFVLSCATTATTQIVSNNTNISDISEAIGKDWKLTEVFIGGKNIGFDRNAANLEVFPNVYTLKIDGENISGTGAPNRYSAPYTVSSEDPLSVKIEVLRSTLMAALYEPEKLREHDFFTYLQNTYKWGLAGDTLELHTKNSSGADVILRFIL